MMVFKEFQGEFLAMVIVMYVRRYPEV